MTVDKVLTEDIHLFQWSQGIKKKKIMLNPIMQPLLHKVFVFQNKLYFWLKIIRSCIIQPLGLSLVAQLVKNLPAIQETWVQSLGREDPL